MVDDLLETFGDKLMSRIPLGRMGEAAEIAAGVVYLASDEAAYVTGTTLHINGGMSMI
jgi:3-oxoacyl-[acyl-carrier protein] reductase